MRKRACNSTLSDHDYAQAKLAMTPDLSEEGEALTPPKRWCRALHQLLGFAGEEPPQKQDPATEAAQIEAAFFASYIYKRPG